MLGKLTIFNTDDQTLSLLQTSWAAQLNSVLANPLMQGTLLRSIDLINGTTQVNHKLGRPLIGWFITRKDGAAEIYDVQAANQIPARTLNLVSNAAVTVDIYCF